MAKAKPNTAQVAASLAEPLLEQMGLRLWDIRFEKEGGVDINDCERFSRAIDPVLDAADPIEQSYCLEVSSPGVERELTRPWHFEENLGRKVNARLIRAKNGIREFSGILESYEDGVAVIRDEENDMTLSVAKSEAAYVRLQDDFDYSKGEDQ